MERKVALGGAKLTGANLTGANLTGAKKRIRGQAVAARHLSCPMDLLLTQKDNR